MAPEDQSLAAPLLSQASPQLGASPRQSLKGLCESGRHAFLQQSPTAFRCAPVGSLSAAPPRHKEASSGSTGGGGGAGSGRGLRRFAVDIVALSREWAGLAPGTDSDSSEGGSPGRCAAAAPPLLLPGGQRRGEAGGNLGRRLADTRWAWCHDGRERNGHIVFNRDGTTSSFSDSRWRVAGHNVVTVDDVRWRGEHQLFFNGAITGFFALPGGQRGYLEGCGFRDPDDAAAPRQVGQDGPVAEASGARSIDPRAFTTLFAFLICNLRTVTILVVMLHGRNWLAVVVLAVPHCLCMLLQMSIIVVDRRIVQTRQTYKRDSLHVRLAVFDAYVLIVLGLFWGDQLRRSSGFFRGEVVAETFLDELSAYGRAARGLGHRVGGLPRFEFHLISQICVSCLAVLAPMLAVAENLSQMEVATYSVNLIASFSLMVFTVTTLDYHASRCIRARCAERSCYRYLLLHVLCRAAEMMGRVLTSVAAVVAHQQHPGCAAIVVLADYATGVGALCWAHGAISGVCFLMSVPFFYANLFVYVDEQGYAVPARRISQFLEAIRGMGSMAAIAVYVSCLVTANGPVGHATAAVLLLMLLPAVMTRCAIRLWCIAGKLGEDLFSVAQHGDQALLLEQILLSKDVTSQMGDRSGDTALHVAAASSTPQCVEMLLQFRAILGMCNSRGDTAFQVACRRGAADIVELLQQAGCHLGEECGAGQPQRGIATHSRTGTVEAYEELDASPGESRRAAGPTAQDTIAKPAWSSASMRRGLFGPVQQSEDRYHLWSRSGRQGSTVSLTSFLFSRGLGKLSSKSYAAANELETSGHLWLTFLLVLGTIGAGGFGTVLQVTDARTGNMYALKLQTKDRCVASAVREAYTLRRTSHAFVVRIYHIFQTREFYGILMELCLTDLNRCILAHRTASGRCDGLPEPKVKRYAACVTLALESLHGKRIVFRDLKPENVLITAQERGDVAKLADFGLARPVDVAPTAAPPDTTTVKAPPGVEGVGPEIGAQGDVGERRGAAGTTTTGPSSHLASNASDSRGTRRDHQSGANPADFWTTYGVRAHLAPDLTVAAGTPAFMAREAYEHAPWAPTAGEAMRLLAGRDFYSLGCCLLLMALGERGGRVVSAEGREVLLPPATAEGLGSALREAAARRSISEDALLLVAALTAELLQDRAGLEAARGSAFLSEAIADLEAVAMQHSTTGA